ncbi:MAG: hypothetical protein ACRYFZ_13665 [Janthinobacterium lividum]
MTTDANGNIFVAGTFTGSIFINSITLSSASSTDIFVAKYVPATNTWAWAQRCGGLGADAAYGIAVSGNSVYVTGTIGNNTFDFGNVTFDDGTGSMGTIHQYGAVNAASNQDIVLLKYLDQGTSAALAWTQVAGGSGSDVGYSIAVNGNAIYLTGNITNNIANTAGVVFGGAGTIPGTLSQLGAANTTASSDVVVAKYLDQGTSAMVAWTQVGGGTNNDSGQSITVNGTAVYITGYATNTLLNANNVLFGGSGNTIGTVAMNGASFSNSQDLVIAKYVDQGLNATLGWVQSAGGQDTDYGSGIAVSGSNIYITGSIYNDLANSYAVAFRNAGTTPSPVAQYGAAATASQDVVVAKYTDQGSTAFVAWTQVGGSSAAEAGVGITLVGTHIYITGTTTANAVFGGAGSTPGTSSVPALPIGSSGINVLAASYTDNGTSATLGWLQTGGSIYTDYGYCLVISSSRLYIAGFLSSQSATFGSLHLSMAYSINPGFFAALDLSATLSTTPATSVGVTMPTVYIWPNPAAGAAILSGAAPGAPVGIFDALGRRVATATADATGAAALPVGLAPGLYLVRAGAGTVRWAVE